MEMTRNVSDWLFYAGGALIKVADTAGSTVIVLMSMACVLMTFPRGAME